MLYLEGSSTKNFFRFHASPVVLGHAYCLISLRAGDWHYRIFADFFYSGSKWHWSCASRYCKASLKTGGEYCTLTKVASASKAVVDAYLFVLGKAIKEVSFKRQVICTRRCTLN